MIETYGLTTNEVQTIFNHVETIPIFEELCTNRNAKVVFKWLYNNLYGNVFKKDKEFNSVLNDNFANGKLLGEIIDLVEEEKLLSPNNAKQIVYAIVDEKYS